MRCPAAASILLSCVFSLSWTSTQKTFHFVSDPMDWLGALKHCTENFESLATIVDGTDLEQLSALAEDGDLLAFVGLKRDWQWTVLDTQDKRESEIKFSKFEVGQPKLENDCGTIGPSGEWSTFTCSTDWPFICYDENISDRFVVGDGLLNWGKSRNFCKRHHTDLARIQSEEENQRVLSLLNGTQAWIGLTKRSWMWSDRTYVTDFSPWVPNTDKLSKGYHCSALNITAGRALGTVPSACNNPLPFFCYSMNKMKHTVRITMSASDVDMAGSAAESVLKMVQDKLNEMGYSKDVRLTWSKRPQKVTAPPSKKSHCTLHVDP